MIKQHFNVCKDSLDRMCNVNDSGMGDFRGQGRCSVCVCVTYHHIKFMRGGFQVLLSLL